MPKTLTRPQPAPFALPLPGHVLTLRIGAAEPVGSAITAQVECHAGPDARCWKRGPEGGGPAWFDGALPEHMLRDADTCIVTERLAGSALFWYDGPSAELQSGPIDVVYRPGYSCTWSYQEVSA